MPVSDKIYFVESPHLSHPPYPHPLPTVPYTHPPSPHSPPCALPLFLQHFLSLFVHSFLIPEPTVREFTPTYIRQTDRQTDRLYRLGSTCERCAVCLNLEGFFFLIPIFIHFSVSYVISFFFTAE